MSKSDPSVPRRVRQGRVAVNSASSMLAQLVAMAIGLWFTPFLVHRLGVEVYGLVPLALMVVSYFALMTDSINVLVGRDFSAAFSQGDRDRAGRIYSTSLLLNYAMGGGFMLIGLALAPFAARLFQVPPGMERTTQWLFVATSVGFFLTCISSVSSSVMFGHNRLELKAGIAVLSNIARVGFVLIAFGMLGPSLQWMSWSILVLAVVTLTGNRLVVRWLEKGLRFRAALFDRKIAHTYLHEGGWVLLNQIGAVLYLRIDLLVVNWFLGPAASGRYALALQWSNVLRSMSGTIVAAFAPTLMMRASLGDLEGMVRFTRHAIRMVGVLLALLIGGLCGFARPLLTVWVGEEYADLAPLLMVLTAHLAVNIAVSPLGSVQVALGKVKVPGLVTFFMGIVNLLLALAVVGPLDWGPLGVAAAGAVVLLAKNAVFTPLYAASISGQRWDVFLRDVFRVVGATAGVWAVAFGISRFHMPTGWMELIGAGAVTATLCLPWIWFLYFTTEDRQSVQAFFKRQIIRWTGKEGSR